MALIINGGISGTAQTDGAYADFVSPTLPSVITLPFTISVAVKNGTATSNSHALMALTAKTDTTGAGNYSLWSRVSRATGPILLASNMYQQASSPNIVNSTYGPEIAISNIAGNGTTVTITTSGNHFFLPGDWVEVTCLSSYSGINGDSFIVQSVGSNTIVINSGATGAYVANAGDKMMYAQWAPGDIWNIVVATFRDVNTAPCRQVFSGILNDAAFRRRTDGTNASGGAAIAGILATADRISFGAILKETLGGSYTNGAIAQAAIWSNKLASQAEAEELLIKPPADVSWGAPTRLWTFVGNTNEANGGPAAVLVGSATVDSSSPEYPTGDLPSVTLVSPSAFINGASSTVFGLNFGAAQGTGKVYISPTNNVADSGRVEQTVTSWSDTEIAFTTVRSTLNYSTPLYLFVVNNSADSNASGYSVQFNMNVVIQETLVDLSGTPAANLTGITAFVWTSEPTAVNSVPDQVLSNLTTNGSGNTSWTLDGTNLVEDDPVWIAIFKDGTPYKASMRKLIPSYL